MDVDVIVVGGGASGLYAGVTASRRGKKVLILEQMDALGKKILATGNGKCNYTNRDLDVAHYRGEDVNFIKRALSRYGHEATVREFQRMGVEPKDRNGYCYPASEQASSVLEVMRRELLHNGVEIRTGEKATEIHKQGDVFTVNANKGEEASSYRGKAVILATGGRAYPTLGSDGGGYSLARSFGHHLVKPLPALVSLKVKESFARRLAGVRVEAGIRLCVDEREAAREVGELQLVSHGISGIPVFQISRFASLALDEGGKVACHLDFFPSITQGELARRVGRRVADGGYKTMGEFFLGMLNHKLARVLLSEAGCPEELVAAQVGEREWKRLVGLMKDLRVTISGTAGWKQAQVTAGGVSTKEVNPDTMESKLTSKLYLTGELLDVDGKCGGYNLQWAWTTGRLAGRDA